MLRRTCSSSLRFINHRTPVFRHSLPSFSQFRRERHDQPHASFSRAASSSIPSTGSDSSTSSKGIHSRSADIGDDRQLENEIAARSRNPPMNKITRPMQLGASRTSVNVPNPTTVSSNAPPRESGYCHSYCLGQRLDLVIVKKKLLDHMSLSPVTLNLEEKEHMLRLYSNEPGNEFHLFFFGHFASAVYWGRSASDILPLLYSIQEAQLMHHGVNRRNYSTPMAWVRLLIKTYETPDKLYEHEFQYIVHDSLPERAKPTELEHQHTDSADSKFERDQAQLEFARDFLAKHDKISVPRFVEPRPKIAAPMQIYAMSMAFARSVRLNFDRKTLDEITKQLEGFVFQRRKLRSIDNLMVNIRAWFFTYHDLVPHKTSLMWEKGAQFEYWYEITEDHLQIDTREEEMNEVADFVMQTSSSLQDQWSTARGYRVEVGILLLICVEIIDIVIRNWNEIVAFTGFESFHDDLKNFRDEEVRRIHEWEYRKRYPTPEDLERMEEVRQRQKQFWGSWSRNSK